MENDQHRQQWHIPEQERINHIKARLSAAKTELADFRREWRTEIEARLFRDRLRAFQADIKTKPRGVPRVPADRDGVQVARDCQLPTQKDEHGSTVLCVSEVRTEDENGTQESAGFGAGIPYVWIAPQAGAR